MLDAVRFCPNHNTALERVEGLRLDIPFGLVVAIQDLASALTHSREGRTVHGHT